MSGPHLWKETHSGQCACEDPNLRISGSPQAYLFVSTAFGRSGGVSAGGSVPPVAPPPPPPSPTTLRRVEAADRAVTQVGDLLASLKDGFVRNVSTPDPERANRRLTESASQTVNDLLENTRAGGQPVFGSRTLAGSNVLRAYADSSGESLPVRRALEVVEQSLRAVPEALDGMRVGSLAEVETASETLDRLGERMDSSRRSLVNAARPSGLDLQA